MPISLPVGERFKIRVPGTLRASYGLSATFGGGTKDLAAQAGTGNLAWDIRSGSPLQRPEGGVMR